MKNKRTKKNYNNKKKNETDKLLMLHLNENVAFISSTNCFIVINGIWNIFAMEFVNMVLRCPIAHAVSHSYYEVDISSHNFIASDTVQLLKCHYKLAIERAHTVITRNQFQIQIATCLQVTPQNLYIRHVQCAKKG